MTTNFKYVQAQVFQLAGAGVAEGDNSMTLESFNQIDGTALTMSNFGIVGYGTLEPGSGINEEQISFTGVVSNVDGTVTLTGISTVLDVYPYTQTANFASGHAGGVAFVISNTAGFYGTFANKNNDETITRIWTFTTATRPLLTVDTDTAVNAALVTYGQLARTAIAGGVNASTTLQGFVQLATQAQYDAKTLTGSTGAKLVATPDLNRATKFNDPIPDTGTTNVYVITPSPAISAYVAGQQFTFLAANTNTSTASLNVSGLGTLALKKNINLSLTGGEIVAGSYITVLCDGTNFQILSTSAGTLAAGFGAVYNANQTLRAVATGTGTQNIAHGLGVTPRLVKIWATISDSGTATLSESNGAATSTSNNTCSYWVYDKVHSGNTLANQSSSSIITLLNNVTPGISIVAAVSALDATNITLNFTTMSGTGTCYIQWEAFA